MQVKYISDMHLYDVYSLGWRPNLTLEQIAFMFEQNWNNSVEDEEDVIIVGDIGYCCERTKNLLRRLNGNKILVIGNHDVAWGNDLYDTTLFKGIYNHIEQNGLYIQHIPDVNTQCSYFIHGHHHRYDLPGMFKTLKLYQQTSRFLNCSADLTGFKPMTLSELITNKELTIESYIEKKIL